MGRIKQIAVIGAGIAGMETAVNLAKAGHKVTIFEKEKLTGGHLNTWSHLFPDFSNPELIVSKLTSSLKEFDVKLISDTEITAIEKLNGRYTLKAGDELNLNADAVVITSGFNIFDATRKEEYGYGLYENVITSADLEQMFAKEGKITTAQGSTPKRIAFIHCVGSRDAKSGNTYCSKVCCITGIKQAIEVNKMLPDTEIFCFYMDLRLYGLNFDDLYLSAQKKHQIQFIRGRLSEASRNFDKSLQIKAEDTLSGRPLRMDVDMIVLLVGMEPGDSLKNLADNNFFELEDNGYPVTENIHTGRNNTTRPGIFMAGACICPMSVNESLESAAAAAIKVNTYFSKNI